MQGNINVLPPWAQRQIRSLESRIHSCYETINNMQKNLDEHAIDVTPEIARNLSYCTLWRLDSSGTARSFVKVFPGDKLYLVRKA